MRAPAALPIAVVLATALAACADAAPDAAGSGLAEWSLAPDPVTSVGRMDGPPEHLFQRIATARLLPDGGVVVGDGGALVVRLYGPDGAFRGEMGRPGDGPGELRSIADLRVVAPDTLVVVDSRLTRVTRFTTDGEVVDTRRVEVDGGWPELFVGVFSDGDLGLGWIVQGARPPDRVTPDPMRFARFDTAGEVVAELGTGQGLRRFGRGPVPFSPFARAVLLRDSLYVTDGLRPEIEVRAPGGVTARTIHIPFEQVDPATARSGLAAELESRGEEAADRLSELGGIPDDSIPHLGEVLVSDAERLWVKRYDPERDGLWVGGGRAGTGGTWWVLEPDGTVVATVDVPDHLTPLDIGTARMLALTRDELGVERVVVHEIVR